MTDKPHPVQPIVVVDGVRRFKANPIVRDLLDYSTARGLGLNEIARRPGYSREDHEQLAQLIGYSLGGAAELSCVSDATLDAAQRAGGEADPSLSEAMRRFGDVVEQVRELVDHQGGSLSTGAGHASLTSPEGRVTFTFGIPDVVDDSERVLKTARAIVTGAWS